jgi:hypothetical protein
MQGSGWEQIHGCDIHLRKPTPWRETLSSCPASGMKNRIFQSFLFTWAAKEKWKCMAAQHILTHHVCQTMNLPPGTLKGPTQQTTQESVYLSVCTSSARGSLWAETELTWWLYSELATGQEPHLESLVNTRCDKTLLINGAELYTFPDK